jgi:exopolysaccharide production protein ExoZ
MAPWGLSFVGGDSAAGPALLQLQAMARERIVSLQILRGVAASMVAACHAPLAFMALGPGLPAEMGVGAAGVDIFFVLSGFVITITGPMATPRPGGALFFWRRWRRVAPVYFLVSLPYLAAAWRHGQVTGAKLAASFLFWPVAGAHAVTPLLEPGWTLCFEMAFYSAVALVLAGGRLRRNLAIGGVIIGPMVLARALVGGDVLGFLANPIFLEFGAGVILANVWRQIARWPAWVGLMLLVLGFSAFGVEAFLGLGRAGDEFAALAGTALALRLILWGLPAVIVVAGALICERFCASRLALALAVGGDASYAIYLVHLGARDTAMGLWHIAGLPLAPGPMIAASVMSAIVLGLLVHRFVETPILRDLKRLHWPIAKERPRPITDAARAEHPGALR